MNSLNVEQSIFANAIEIASPEDRAKYLEDVCRNDAGLREAIESLIDAHDRLKARHVTAPTNDGLRLDLFGDLSLQPGSETIGPYKLQEVIGEGGMGTVWMADQSEPVRRMVALKVIKPGMDTKQVLARFEAERQALAMMDHPNIARVFDGGTTAQGRPYFVMELVRGVPITEYCDRERLTIDQRLNLFADVCRAVQHAHQKGIIHRDLKPTNILVTVIDGQPVPKVIDFGVAKAVVGALTDRTLHTGFHQFVGTPLYMSPEQAELAGTDVDTRSDIYSLGVLLYELLTGTTPFDSQALKQAAFDEMRRMIREDEPPRPSTRLSFRGDTQTTVADARQSAPKRLSSMLKGELDWIVMKALEKSPGNRYPTADALAADLIRFRNHQPIEARPPSLVYAVSKLARRNRAALTTASLVLLAMLAGTGVSIWQAVRATRAEKKTAAALEVAKAESERAEQQRKLASEQFEIAREAVDAMYTEAAEKWLSQGDRPSPVQQEFLNRALNFYQRFATAPGRDPEARHKALHALARVGEIQSSLGRLDLAERAFAESLTFARDLAAEAPDRPEYRRDETQAHEAFGNVLLARGKPAEAEPVLRAGLELQEAFVAADPTPENRLSLVSLLTEYGHLMEHTRRIAEAEAAHRRGLGILEDMAATHADKEIYRTTLANNQSALGRLLRQSGRLAEADQAYRRCLAVIEPRVRSRPKDPDTQKALATMLMGWGLVQWDLGQLDKAEETMRRAIAVDESLTADFPTTPGYRVQLARALAELADLLEHRGDTEKAELMFERARTLLNDLIASSPDYSRFRTDLSELERRRRFSMGVTRASLVLDQFLQPFDPLLRNRTMWQSFRSNFRSVARRSRPSRPNLRPGIDNLEARVVLTSAFESVLAVGNDTADIKVLDNAVDSAGNTYVVGNLYGTIDFDPTVDRPDGSDILTPRGTTDPFIAKYAPDNTLVWARRMGSDYSGTTPSGTPVEGGSAITIDNAGYVYVVGNFAGQADFGSLTLTSAGDLDGFVTKIDANGSVVWAKRWGSANRDYGNGIAVDGAGNVVTVGYDFSQTSGITGFEVCKFNASGATVWNKRFNNSGGTAESVVTDSVGNVYMTGRFSGTLDFNPDSKKTNNVSGATGLTFNTGRNGYVLKLTSAGAYGWVSPFIAKTAEVSASLVACNDLAIDGGGNVVVVGKYGGQVDFDPSSSIDYRLPANGLGFVVKLSSSGARSWATSLGGATIRSVALDTTGSIYTTGTFTGTFSPGFGLPDVTSQRWEDVFVATLTPSGSVDWAVTIGGDSSDLATGIAVGSDGTIHLAGWSFSSALDYDPDPIGTYVLNNPAYANMFLLKLRKR